MKRLVLALLAALVVGGLFAARFGQSELPAAPGLPDATIPPESVIVLDGDTIRLPGIATAIRLVGFNAPETSRPGCDAEKALGERATNRLRELVRAGALTFERVPCACPAGTEGTPSCNFGRACGKLFAAGRDIAAVLIREGLAAPFTCGATRCPKMPRPWCGSE